MDAQRIAIVGCVGAGKSRLASALGERLGVPVIHGDKVFWRPGWTDPQTDEFRADVARLTDNESWIYDGNLGRVADIVLPRARTILWIEQPAWLCALRVYGRTLRYLNRNRPEMAEGCPERMSLSLLGYIRNFDRHLRPQIEAWLVEHAPKTPVVRLKGDGEVADFLGQQDIVRSASRAKT